MDSRDLLRDAFGRVRQLVERSVAGLDAAALAYRPDDDANSIAWLTWHLTRVQDDHVAEIAGRRQAWIDGGWAEAFGMEPDPHDTGFGHSSEQVAAVRPATAQILIDYHDAVFRRTSGYLETVDADELNRIIDTSYQPPVSVGVRLVSVLSDDLQHAGQAMYVRGIYERR